MLPYDGIERCNPLAVKRSPMKPAPSRKKQPPANSLKDWWRSRMGMLAIGLITAGLVVILGAQFESLFSRQPPTVPSTSRPSPIAPATPKVAVSDAPVRFPTVRTPTMTNGRSETIAPSPKNMPTPILSPRIAIPNWFGHLPYDEAPPDRLVSIGKFERENYVREESLDGEAAQAFQVMVAAARSQGVQLMGISGFRSIADQQALFDKQIEKRGSAEAAAQLSAPPAYSEHHTGYAIDITDASRTDVDLKVMFEATAAYQWLVANATNYGFEQSFPRNNAQGVSYEPWHWRFVGSTRSAQIFTSARSGN
jgi:zinc D-Ala-D-Ala carboxypeptidase